MKYTRKKWKKNKNKTIKKKTYKRKKLNKNNYTKKNRRGGKGILTYARSFLPSWSKSTKTQPQPVIYQQPVIDECEKEFQITFNNNDLINLTEALKYIKNINDNYSNGEISELEEKKMESAIKICVEKIKVLKNNISTIIQSISLYKSYCLENNKLYDYFNKFSNDTMEILKIIINNQQDNDYEIIQKVFEYLLQKGYDSPIFEKIFLSLNPKPIEGNVSLTMQQPIEGIVDFTENRKKILECDDSALCLAFGKDNNMIKELFNNFGSFDNVKNIEKIGDKSANGLIFELTYINKDLEYISNCILKSSSSNYADNLYYEYIVGLFINKLNNCYPCFLETYRIFKYNDLSSRNIILSKKKLNNNYLTTSLRDITLMSPTDLLQQSCLFPEFICILIQSINTKTTLKQRLVPIDESTNSYEIVHAIEFLLNNIINILLQI
jgi:hypothetical protein